MKYALLVLGFVLCSCAPEQQQPTTWNMSWRCYTNYCYSHISPNSWGGNGSFSSDDSCLAWEYGFLNTAGAGGGGGVTACTAN